ncbi:MAG: CDP-alcohol phosphatidyltransferase family protein [Clostridia bacterium]|nr:CDP-alcohol phosphatidyltransferase family protein [Clostridia bacterium]MDE7306231.1 CDP-alcohol phosphatidyltransferase family protein [Clostridia bacterium]
MKNSKFIGYYHYGVILTYLSAAAGIVGSFLSVTVSPEWGVICLLISGLCDAFDGAVAKTRKNRTEDDKIFGIQIDSFSDLIAFGVAPVMIGYGMGMHAWYYVIIFCLFVLCALIRLAYYNVKEEIRTRDPESGRLIAYFGLPVTCIAVGLPIFYLVATIFEVTLATQLIMCACYLIAGFLYILKFKMPKLRIKGLLVTIAIVTALIIGLFLARHFVRDIWFLLNV